MNCGPRSIVHGTIGTEQWRSNIELSERPSKSTAIFPIWAGQPFVLWMSIIKVAEEYNEARLTYEQTWNTR